MDIQNNGWIDIKDIIEIPITSEDKDKSEEISLNLKFQQHDAVGGIIFSQRVERISDYEWRISEKNINNMKIYIGEVSEDILIELKATSEENNLIAYSPTYQVEVNANAKLYAPILETNGSIIIEEDKIIPILQEDGGNISVVQQGNQNNPNEVVLQISGIDKRVKVVKADFENNIVLSNAINSSVEGEHIDSISLNYDEYRGVGLILDKDFNGAIAVEVQAYSEDKGGERKYSRKNISTINILPVNDAPEIRNEMLVKSISEGEN